jgi:hypothetical protein
MRIFYLVIAATLTANVSAETAVIGASKDSAIFQSHPSNAGGGSPGIHAGTNNNGSIRRGLIAFDVGGAVPAGSTINSVQLTMYLGNAPSGNPTTIGLHKLDKDWGEGTAGSSATSLSGTGNGFPASAGDATWSHAMLGSIAWANPGAGGDFNSTASSGAIVAALVNTPFTWNSTPALVADVQNWLDTPAANFGWVLANANESALTTQRIFYSRSAVSDSNGNPLDPAWRPTLTVTYSPGLDGDFNEDGRVDAADYVVWRKTDGSSEGYAAWQEQFGQTTGGGGLVPEPASTVLGAWCAAVVAAMRSRHWRPN